jgi:RHS repeat-associated protein
MEDQDRRAPPTRPNASGAPEPQPQESLQPAVPNLSLPKGGGAIRGIGEKFSVNAATGTASASIPIFSSPGRSGFGPDLALSYNSGSGNTPIGFGWALSLASVTRKTDKGLPVYRDEVESDVFVLSGAEDLMPALSLVNGQWIRDVVSPRTLYGAQYAIHRYRPRVEGLFARIERWANLADPTDVFWRSISRNNATTWYGRTAASRIADPADPTRVFSWLICESHDDKGNVISYDYKPEDSSNVDLTQTNECNRTDASRSANRYLKTVSYGNRTPYYPDLSAPTAVPLPTDWCFQLVLDYGEHDLTNPLPTGTTSWTSRSDPFSSYRARFEVRTYRLCRRALMFHHFPDAAEIGLNCLVRTTDFSHAQPVADPVHPFYSFLTAVSQSGYRRATAGGYDSKAFPPVEYEYSTAAVDPTVRDIDASSLQHLPQGLDGRLFRWTDLDGEGVSGILSEQGTSWLYKANLSPVNLRPDGGHLRAQPRFAAVETLADVPSLAALNKGRQQLMDLTGNGHLDLVDLGEHGGFFERTDDEEWRPFVPFPSLPNVDWSDPELKFVDLTGDGLPDVLISEASVFCWHESLGAYGYGPRHSVPQAFDEEDGPKVVFADGTDTIFLADMSGDGLVDLVRIRNGEVCYWPNKGYGRFGAKVTMDNAPLFDRPDLFDPRRLRLADIDGSGTADIVYFGSGTVSLYFNSSGNGWGQPYVLTDFPFVESVSSADALDLLGNGTACLVWSSPLPGSSQRQMRYIDLMGGLKPHLLVQVTNNLGAETLIQYAPSTRFYVADKLAGTPWVTRLPFPVQVVEGVRTYDYVSRTILSARYSYHHGYFDGVEREFRGFGRVDQVDTEDFAVLSASDAFPAPVNLSAATQVPPVFTKTWFHTGAYFGEPRISRHMAAEYYVDPAALQLPDSVLPTSILRSDGSNVPHAFTPEEYREAARALRGSTLRQEIYSLDGTDASARPYLVSENNFGVEALQPQAPNRYGVYFSHARESISYHYERKLYAVGGQSVADPRVMHSFTLSVDAYGNILRSAAVAYGRRHADPALSPQDSAKQTSTLSSCTLSTYTNAVQSADVWRTALIAEVADYELLQLQHASPAGFGFDELGSELAAASDGAHDIAFENLNPALNPGQPYRRLLKRTRTYYRPDDFGASSNDANALLPLGSLEALALAGVSYRLALTNSLIALVYQRSGTALLPTPAMVLASTAADGGGYVDLDGNGNWWAPSGRIFYTAAAATPQAESTEAHGNFFLARRYVDAFGSTTSVDYDSPNNLLVVATHDAVQNSVTATCDYRVLLPTLITDPNGNRSAVSFDLLGLVAGTALMGKTTQSVGDSLTGFIADLTQPQIDDFYAADDPHALAPSLLANATSRVVYDLDRFRNSQAATPSDPTQWVPAFAALLTRETHVSNLATGQQTRIQINFGYSDGFGREIQYKCQAEPATGTSTPRWVGTGWTVFNNKNNPVRRYEPFFSALPKGQQFEFGTSVGVSDILCYDPMTRVVATVHPNHSYQKVVFDPWRQVSWDANDTVLQADPSADVDVGAMILPLPTNDYLPTWYAQRSAGALGPLEQAAANKAAAHANTPAVSYIDSLGRPFLTVADNGADGKFESRIELDIKGLRRSVSDALGRQVMVSDYDMLGNAVHHASMEAAERWMLSDAAGKSIRSWDARGHNFRSSFDARRRLIGEHVMGTDAANCDPRTTAAEVQVSKIVYGEGQPNDVTLNLRTRVYTISDTAGVVTNMDLNPVSGLAEAYDFKGNLLRKRRQFIADHRALPDWAAPPLLSDSFASNTQYDALNRPTAATTPDGSVTLSAYNAANLLETVGVKLRGTATQTPFIMNIDYDAKGRRTLIEFGNGARTTYEYDPLTFRLIHLLTQRNSAAFPDDCPQPPPANWPGCQVQNLVYTYDPVGNITSIRDNAQQTIYFRNQRVEPSNEYTYDAIYRLTQATGREHLGLVSNGNPLPPTAGSYNDASRIGLLSPNDGNAMGTYTEQYEYDAVGNFLKFIHQGSQPANPGWTRAYTYNEPSRLESGRVSNRLSSTVLGGSQALTETYNYDLHGSMTSMPQLQAMQWNFKDELQISQRQAVNATDTDGELHKGERTYYVYDFTGQRARKVTEASTGIKRKERFYLGGFEDYREYDSGGAVTLERESLHVMDDKQRVALVETRTQGDDGSPAQLMRYQFSNHLGSASLELDDAGQIVSYEEYYPYGNTSYQAGRSVVEVGLKRYRYTGMERDEETGLNHHGARYYALWLGRWASCDPIVSINLYCFNQCNPVNLVDPQGEEPKKPTVGPYAKVGGDHVHQVASRTQKVGDPRKTAPLYDEANAVSTKDSRLYDDPAAQKVEAAINRSAWGANFDDYYPAGQNGQKVKSTSGGITREAKVSITTSGETTVGSTRSPAGGPYFEDTKSYYKLLEGGYSPEDALAEVFKSSLQLEHAGAAASRVPNTPPNFQTDSSPKSRASSQPSVFRRGETGLEPVKTFTPSRVGSDPEPSVKPNSAGPGIVVNPDTPVGPNFEPGLASKAVGAAGVVTFAWDLSHAKTPTQAVAVTANAVSSGLGSEIGMEIGVIGGPFGMAVGAAVGSQAPAIVHAVAHPVETAESAWDSFGDAVDYFMGGHFMDWLD